MDAIFGPLFVAITGFAIVCVIDAGRKKHGPTQTVEAAADIVWSAVPVAFLVLLGLMLFPT
jgi:heme/copper-type cytochrome/quinol oxidase subunit 2